jgi:hypothetical protein
MNSFLFIFVVFVISVGVYIFLKAQGNWKRALVELVRALTVIFGCIAGVGESFGRIFRAISNGLKYFDEESNLEAIKEREDQKEALALAAKTIYSELKALRDSDEETNELLYSFIYDNLSDSYKIVFTRFMEFTEREKFISKIQEVANSAITGNMYYVAEITTPKLVTGSGGKYVSMLIFDLKMNNEQRERRLAQHTERDRSEVDSVESVLD